MTNTQKKLIRVASAATATALVGGAFAIAAAPTQARPWSAASVLSNAAVDTTNGSPVRTAAGITETMTQDNGSYDSVLVRSSNAAGVFNQTARLVSGTENASLRGDTAQNANGTAFFGWKVNGTTTDTLNITYRTKKKAWANRTVHTADDATHTIYNASSAINEKGQGVFAYTVMTNATNSVAVWAVTRGAKGKWSGPIKVAEGTALNTGVEAVISQSGWITVQWTEDTGTGGAARVVVAVKKLNKAFYAPRAISDAATSATNTHITVGADGTVTAGWMQPLNGINVVYSAFRKQGKPNFTTPRLLSNPAFDASNGPSLAATDKGEVLLGFTQASSAAAALAGTDEQFITRTRTKGGNWHSNRVHQTCTSVNQFDVAASGKDKGVAAWNCGTGGFVVTKSGGKWAGPRQLSTTVSNPGVSIAASGAAVSTWYQAANGKNVVLASTKTS